MKNWEGEKFRAQSARKKIAAALPLFQFASTYWGHMLFCPPPSVEAMHAVTIMSLKATVVQLSVGTLLTSRQIR